MLLRFMRHPQRAVLRLRPSRHGIKLDDRGLFINRLAEPGPVRVTVNGHPVWTVTPRLAEQQEGTFYPWPASLRPRLRGSAACSVEGLGSLGTRWNGTVRWSSGSESPDLHDSLGRPLVVNKWGRLRTPLAAESGPDRRPEVAGAAAAVLGVLNEAGYRSFIVGGTLLGAVRDGMILPHDDDADIAYLSRFSHPSDLVVEAHRIDQVLIQAGFTAVRHSWSHVQVLTKAETGVTDFYVDIFTAFYKDGYFNEPIHMRNLGLDNAILPLSSLEMHGITFPAPADPEAWLAACYGDDWRVPQPGFEFQTPASTKRRFDSWFSSFNQHRHFWNDLHAAEEAPPASILVHSYVAAAQRENLREIVDLGSGAGVDLRWYEEQGWRVHPVDYSWFAASRSHPNFALVNLANYTESFSFLSARLGEITERSNQPPLVSLNHLLGCLDGFGRPNMLRLIAFLLRNGAEVIAADYSTLGQYEFSDPMSWHYDLDERRRDAHKHNLRVELFAEHSAQDAAGVSRMVEVVAYRLGDEEKGAHSWD